MSDRTSRLRVFRNPLLIIFFVVAIPLAVTLFIVYNQAMESERQLASLYAQSLQNRLKETNDQSNIGFSLLQEAGFDNCSADEIALMRQIDISSTHLQAIGKVAGNDMICSSFGSHDPIPLGLPLAEYSNGIRVRHDVSLPFAEQTQFSIVELGGYAVVIREEHYFDIVAAGVEEISMAHFSMESGQVTIARGFVDPAWVDLFNDGFSSAFLVDGFVIAGSRSDEYVTASLVAIPVTNVLGTFFSMVSILLPTSLAACVVLVILVWRLMRQSRELQTTSFTLGERVKEQTLLHSMARYMMSPGRTEAEVLDFVVNQFPGSMQFPEMAQVRVCFRGNEYLSPNWLKSQWRIIKPLKVEDSRDNSIEISYSQKPPVKPAFMPEEHELLGSVADMLVSFVRHKRAEQHIRNLAYLEPVTGLPNRAMLEEEINASADGVSNENRLALCIVCLDGFKDAVSTLGFSTGDDLLRQVAARFRHELQSAELIAGLGGNEFAILYRGSITPEVISSHVESMISTFDSIMIVGTIPLKLDATIGIALSPDHGRAADTLLRHAEIALRHAIESNRHYAVYDTSVDHYRPEKIALLAELPAAIENHELVLHYQPKVEIRTGKITGMEALVRWQHPDRGMVFPDQFIPYAEQTQIINPLSRWVVLEALGQCVKWFHQGYDFEIAINLSVRNLLDDRLCQELPILVAESGLPISNVVFEITESAFMSNPEECIARIEALRNQGFQFSIDDFGVGQSSFSYIKELQIQRLKIDKSFVMHFSDSRNEAIVRAAIGLAHSLDLEVTAEGIEDENTLRSLRDLHCDLGQGYFISKGLSAAEMTDWLKDTPFQPQTVLKSRRPI